MHLDLQLQEQHSSPTESTPSSPLQELTPMGTMGKTNSQDQCASSESVHDEGKCEPHIKPARFACNPELSMNVTQAEISQPMVSFQYGYSDPYLGGLFTYGPHAMLQPQVMGAGAGRVPLPADFPEDGPIYVNAKQYHGILRRRQTRAKLEVQNKLVKNRRPYLHESRHQHALNRVRGTGGRFLSTKKTHHSGSNPATSSQNTLDAYHFSQHESMLHANHHQYENRHHGSSSTAEGISVSSVDAGFQHMVMSMQGGGGLVYNGTRHYNASSTVG